MTESLVERVKRLAEKATAAPWIASGVVSKAGTARQCHILAQFAAPTGEAVLASLPMGRTDAEYLGALADQHFIAAARTDAPRLCDLVEELARRADGVVGLREMLDAADGALDKDTYEQILRADYDMPDDAEISITAGTRRKINALFSELAIQITNARAALEKMKQP